MTSYISTQSISSSLRQSMLRMQSELAAGQSELTTGVHADIGLTLGARTGESVSLQAEGALLEVISQTNSTTLSRLGSTQSVLEFIRDSAQTLLNAVVEASGAARAPQALAVSAQANLTSLISGLNSTSGGSFIFAGIDTGNQPVADYYAPAAAHKQAVDAAFLAAFNLSQSSTGVSGITGGDMQNFLDGPFAALFQGSNWTQDWSTASDLALTNQISASQTIKTSVSANEPAFRKLTEAYVMMADLGASGLSADAYHALAQNAEKILTEGIDELIGLQTRVGAAQAQVTSADDHISLQMNLLSTQVGDLESVNSIEAATRVSDLQTQIETAYSLTAHLHQLSLVKFL